MKTFISFKLFKIIALTALVVMMMTNCRKNDDDVPAPTYPETQMLNSYLTATGFSQIIVYQNSGDYEFGVEFSSNVKGKIKALSVKVPDTNPKLRVTIWDAVSKTVLRSEMLNVTAANTVAVKTISDFPVEKDKKYALTMNSNDWYDHRNPASTTVVYPLQHGQFTFYQYLYHSGATQTYPNIQTINYYGGDVDFVFQQTD